MLDENPLEESDVNKAEMERLKKAGVHVSI